MKTIQLAAVCWLTLTVVGLRASEKAKPWTPRDEARAETESVLPRSWTELYKSYKKFAKCDDGGVGEGYSDSIARLVSDQWIAAGQLNRLASRNQGFERFVLRHIDVLMTPEQAKKIARTLKLAARQMPCACARRSSTGSRNQGRKSGDFSSIVEATSRTARRPRRSD